MSSWLLFALLSAIAAALVSIFDKIGLDGIDANVATTVR
ncbi:EamA family transporter, partial [Bacillus sp. B-TM1]